VRPVIASPRRINLQISLFNPSSTVNETPSVPQKIAFMVKMALTFGDLHHFAAFWPILFSPFFSPDFFVELYACVTYMPSRPGRISCPHQENE
jgi:hypothetical protein